MESGVEYMNGMENGGQNERESVYNSIHGLSLGEAGGILKKAEEHELAMPMEHEQEGQRLVDARKNALVGSGSGEKEIKYVLTKMEDVCQEYPTKIAYFGDAVDVGLFLGIATRAGEEYTKNMALYVICHLLTVRKTNNQAARSRADRSSREIPRRCSNSSPRKWQTTETKMKCEALFMR